jgi:serine protease Do
MRRKQFGWVALISVAISALIIGIIITAKLDWSPTSKAESMMAPAQNYGRQEAPARMDSEPLTFSTFRRIAKESNPGVVNIYTTQIIKQRYWDPFEEFRKFFGDEFFAPQFPREREFKTQSLGSGLIVDEGGYILTNNHVVENADDVRVTLYDETSYKAKVVGKDPRTDIALLKIEPKKKLHALPLGNSDNLMVGDWVIAIGNPFGLGHTLTVGVVSAKGRNFGRSDQYEDFIQIDAPINPGNSGGPLLNIYGEVVGINAMIVTRGSDWAGVGFAIPINLAKDILPQLKEKGEVIRGWLGVYIPSSKAEDMLSSLGASYGAPIIDVEKGSPADKAGLKRYDVILEFDGKKIEKPSDLPWIVGMTRPGKEVSVKILRDKKEKTITLKLGTLEPEGQKRAEVEEETKGDKLGIKVKEITPEMRKRLNLDDEEGGVFVSSVQQDSPAEYAGLQEGDVILEINKKPVRSIDDYKKFTKEAGDELLLLIKRNGQPYILVIKIK